MESLPQDIIEYITVFLEVTEIGRFSRTSKTLHGILSRDQLWKTMSILHFSQLIKMKEYNGSWKELFKNLYVQPIWDLNCKTSHVVLSDDYLTATSTVSSQHESVRAARGWSKGRHYFEVLILSTASNLPNVAIVESSYDIHSTPIWKTSTHINYSYIPGSVWFHAYQYCKLATYVKGDYVGIYLDCDACLLAFYKNKELLLTIKDSNMKNKTMFPVLGLYDKNHVIKIVSRPTLPTDIPLPETYPKEGKVVHWTDSSNSVSYR